MHQHWCYVMLPQSCWKDGVRVDASRLQTLLHNSTVTLTCQGRGAKWAQTELADQGSRTLQVPTVDGVDIPLHVFVDRKQAAPPPPSTPAHLQNKRVLVVGAGGIGCELLKDLVLLGVPHIDTIDLDTIDGTNLNRQFLFQLSHVGQSKSVVAAQVVSSWGREGVHVTGFEGNIKDPKYSDDFFSQFSIVINGLDNVSARKHVNRMCVNNNVPLVESGTMGYNGQVQPIIRGKLECYDCSPKATEQKTFAVCTIHARPTTMVHCVHYAKELYARLFGDAIVVEGNKQKSEFDDIDVDSTPADAATRRLYTALFVDKIQAMLDLQKQWTITPPQPLPAADECLRGAAPPAVGDSDKPENAAQLYALLRGSIVALQARGARRPFDKDDGSAMSFVTAIANLRALCFHIALESPHRVKTIAGNIVPAIASTNAVIAACAVDAAMTILKGGMPEYVTLRHVAQVRRRVLSGKSGASKRRVKDQLLLHTIPPTAPNPKCLVCSASDRTFSVRCNGAAHTLSTFVKSFLMREMGLVAPTVDHGSSTIYEHEEFEDLAEQPLSKWVALGGHAVPLTVGDLHQSIEWTIHVSHDGSLDEATFRSDWNGALPPVVAPTTPPETSDNHQPSAVTGDDDDVVAYHPASSSTATKRATKTHRVEVPPAHHVETIDD